jgi:putative ABC transport system ATP-binding protein
VRLEATGLTRTVEGRTLFRGLDLALDSGESLVIHGPSGSGKTTLLRALAGLDPLQAGAVRLDARTPEDWGWPCWRREVRYVPQKVPVFPGKPLDLVALVRRFRTCRQEDWTDPVELARRWKLPVTAWERPWGRLSGGEQQRVMLAVALAADPTVVLLDEPTTGLDPAAAEAVEAELKGRSAIWVTHDPAQSARVADRRVELAGPAELD